MNKAELKEDWLFTNALVAFVGALLMGAGLGTGGRHLQVAILHRSPKLHRVHNFHNNHRNGHLVDCPGGRPAYYHDLGILY